MKSDARSRCPSCEQETLVCDGIFNEVRCESCGWPRAGDGHQLPVVMTVTGASTVLGWIAAEQTGTNRVRSLARLLRAGADELDAQAAKHEEGEAK